MLQRVLPSATRGDQVNESIAKHFRLNVKNLKTTGFPLLLRAYQQESRAVYPRKFRWKSLFRKLGLPVCTAMQLHSRHFAREIHWPYRIHRGGIKDVLQAKQHIRYVVPGPPTIPVVPWGSPCMHAWRECMHAWFRTDNLAWF